MFGLSNYNSWQFFYEEWAKRSLCILGPFSSLRFRCVIICVCFLLVCNHEDIQGGRAGSSQRIPPVCQQRSFSLSRWDWNPFTLFCIQIVFLFAIDEILSRIQWKLGYSSRFSVQIKCETFSPKLPLMSKFVCDAFSYLFYIRFGCRQSQVSVNILPV